jgi:hypothetical protein
MLTDFIMRSLEFPLKRKRVDSSTQVEFQVNDQIQRLRETNIPFCLIKL